MKEAVLMAKLTLVLLRASVSIQGAPRDVQWSFLPGGSVMSELEATEFLANATMPYRVSGNLSGDTLAVEILELDEEALDRLSVRAQRTRKTLATLQKQRPVGMLIRVEGAGQSVEASADVLLRWLMSVTCGGVMTGLGPPERREREEILAVFSMSAL